MFAMTSEQLTIYLQFFIGMMAIINPVGLLPVFVSLTSHQTPPERNNTALSAVIAVAVILLVVLYMGQAILSLFSISIASFRIAGGVLITMIAFSMLQGRLGQVKHNKEEDRENATKESVAVVPLALPLMAGPGAMSSVIVYAAEHAHWWDYLFMTLAIVMVALVCWLIFRAAPLLNKVMGQTGINVVTRIMGLIMMAIGVEFLAAGVKQIFPALT